jgi:BirA family biotin operon repressor/biotin-[acetyl-CoA-carboxylase] ligase
MDTVFSKRSGNGFTDADLDHVVASTLVEEIEFHREIESTNDRALELAGKANVRCPLLVLAESQTNGRGRGAHSWWADQGSLTFTLLLKTDLPPARLPQVSLTAGLAVCEAMEDVIDQTGVRLKWPNDVYFQERKLCGLLIELPPRQFQLIAIGIGINVNNSTVRAPQELASSAIALCDVVKQELFLTEVLVRTLGRLEERLGWIGYQDAELWNKWRERCLLTGRTVGLEIGTRHIEGLCRGIDEQGALLVDTPTGTERCFAGSVTKF